MSMMQGVVFDGVRSCRDIGARFPTVPIGESRTRTEFKEECDVNRILARFAQQGVLDHVNKYPGGYADLIGAPEYHEACNRIIAAREMFMSLPSDIRSRFENDPGKFLEFANDNANEEEMRKMGLLPQKAAETPKDASGEAVKPKKVAEANSPLKDTKASAESAESA